MKEEKNSNSYFIEICSYSIHIVIVLYMVQGRKLRKLSCAFSTITAIDLKLFHFSHPELDAEYFKFQEIVCGSVATLDVVTISVFEILEAESFDGAI